MYYTEKKLNPEIEKEIKKGFFEIKKKFDYQSNNKEEQVLVYLSHVILQNVHPIFCKMNMETVKIILQFSQIIYLSKG